MPPARPSGCQNDAGPAGSLPPPPPKVRREVDAEAMPEPKTPPPEPPPKASSVNSVAFRMQEALVVSGGQKFKWRTPRLSNNSVALLEDLFHVRDHDPESRLYDHLGVHVQSMRNFARQPMFIESIVKQITAALMMESAMIIYQCTSGRHRSVAAVQIAEAVLKKLVPMICTTLLPVALGNQWHILPLLVAQLLWQWVEMNRDPDSYQQFTPEEQVPRQVSSNTIARTCQQNTTWHLLMHYHYNDTSPSLALSGIKGVASCFLFLDQMDTKTKQCGGKILHVDPRIGPLRGTQRCSG